jgi:hypothetical protein
MVWQNAELLALAAGGISIYQCALKWSQTSNRRQKVTRLNSCEVLVEIQ